MFPLRHACFSPKQDKSVVLCHSSSLGLGNALGFVPLTVVQTLQHQEQTKKIIQSLCSVSFLDSFNSFFLASAKISWDFFFLSSNTVKWSLSKLLSEG